jgi:hypothetical protein
MKEIMAELSAEDTLVNDLTNMLALADADHKAAFDKDRDSLRTLQLRNHSSAINQALILIKRDIANGEFDIEKHVKHAEFHIWDMGDKIAHSLNTADNCVFRGDLNGNTAVLEVLNANKFNF